MLSDFSNVETYVDAMFADLIFTQGFDVKFRRSDLDVMPIKLFDKMSNQSTFPDFEVYKAFASCLNADIRGNIASQVDRAKRGLIGMDGGFIMDAVNAKTAKLSQEKERLSTALTVVRDRVDRTPMEQRGDLMETLEFYEKAVELLESRLRMFQQ